MLGFDGPLVEAVSLRHCYDYRVNVSIPPWFKERLCNIIYSLLLYRSEEPLG